MAERTSKNTARAISPIRRGWAVSEVAISATSVSQRDGRNCPRGCD